MNNPKILLIDYDPVSINETVTPLARAGYDVEVAKDGVSGLAAFERVHPALVLVEAMLPRKHGFEVCREIKAKPGGKTTPVLITTAICRGRKYRMDALQIYGCDEYIEKPISDEKLVSMIGRFIEQNAEADEEVRKDLSAAIDAVPQTGDGASDDAIDAPAAIESMSDDELEARIDALLMADEPADAEQTPPTSDVVVAEEEPAPAPTEQTIVAVEQEPVEEPTVEDEEPAPAEEDPRADSEDPAFDAGTELERRVAAMVQVDPVEIDQPATPVLRDEQPEAESAAGEFSDELETSAASETPAEAIAEPEQKREWVETGTTERTGPPKVLLLAVATVAAAGVVGFLAFQQGWIGGSEAPAEARASVPAKPQAAPPAGRSATEPAAVPQRVPQQNEPAAEVVSAPTEQPAPAPKPVVPPKPAAFQGRSATELQAARDREQQAEEAMLSAAGALQSSLLSSSAGESLIPADEPAHAVDVDDTLIGTPVRPKARRGQLFEIDDVDRVPVPVRFEQPVYDEMARRLRQEGEILVAVLIDERGTVVEAHLTQEIPRSRLNDAALRAAGAWVYRPATKDGVPVRVWKTERIVFTLE